MSDEEQPEEQPEDTPIQIEEPAEDDNPPLRQATSTDNDEHRGPSVQRSNDSYQPARSRTNVNNMNLCQKIIISIVSALFVLSLFISTCLAVNAQIKSEMKQFRKEFEAKNELYNAELDIKMTHEKVQKELELLKDTIALKDAELAATITDLDDLKKQRNTKLADIGKNCMLQDLDGNHDKDQDFCCQLLAKEAKDLTSITNMQQFEHCLSLMLTLRYELPMEDDESDKSRGRRRRAHCPPGKRTRIFLCCTKRYGITHCDDFRGSDNKPSRKLRGYCRLCYKENICPNLCGVAPVGR